MTRSKWNWSNHIYLPTGSFHFCSFLFQFFHLSKVPSHHGWIQPSLTTHVVVFFLAWWFKSRLYLAPLCFLSFLLRMSWARAHANTSSHISTITAITQVDLQRKMMAYSLTPELLWIFSTQVQLNLTLDI